MVNMMEFIEKVEDLQFDIELINATLDYLRDKYFEQLWEEEMYLANYYISEINRLNDVLDKKYKEQEKAYKELLILHL